MEASPRKMIHTKLKQSSISFEVKYLINKFLLIFVISTYSDKVDDQTTVVINEHFSPSWRICDVCEVPFNFIGKMETRNEDLRYLNQKLDLRFPNISIHKTITSRIDKRRGEEPTKVIERHIMNTLPREKVQFLCEFFKLDFLLFDYHSPYCDFKQEKQNLLKNKS